MDRIGLIAGNRKFPLLFAQSARKRKCSVVAVAIKGDTDRNIVKLVDKVYWIGLGDFQRMIDVFKTEKIDRIVMAGQVSPHRLFSREVRNNQTIQEILGAIKDKKADSIFGAVAQKLAQAGLALEDSRTFMEDYIPKKGVLTAKEPSFDDWEDIYFGFELAKTIAYFDIGQTVAVKEKAVVAVEALEGTDRLIRRAGQIAGGQATIVKVAKPKQDMRFDIPVIGLNTIKNLVRIKAKSLAIEAGKTLFIDKEPALHLADRRGLSIVSV